MANSGIEAVIEENTETERSRKLFSCIPASTPNSIDSGTITAKLIAASSSVLPSRSHRMLATGAR